MQVNDGSTLSGLQIVVNPECEGYGLIEDGQVATGASVAVIGELTESPGGRQKASPSPGPSKHSASSADLLGHNAKAVIKLCSGRLCKLYHDRSSWPCLQPPWTPILSAAGLVAGAMQTLVRSYQSAKLQCCLSSEFPRPQNIVC